MPKLKWGKKSKAKASAKKPGTTQLPSEERKSEERGGPSPTSPSSPSDWEMSMSPIIPSAGAPTPGDAMTVDQTYPVDAVRVSTDDQPTADGTQMLVDQPTTNDIARDDAAATGSAPEPQASADEAQQTPTSKPSDATYDTSDQRNDLADMKGASQPSPPADCATSQVPDVTPSNQDTPAQETDKTMSTNHPLRGMSGPPSDNIAMDTQPSPSGADASGAAGGGHDVANGSASVHHQTTSSAPLPPPALADLMDSVPNMYRILDLVSETGSGGLVDKIIISQQSLGRFINDVCPGAYQSMTHVNFSALDHVLVQPLGLYGSKSELVRYMEDMSLVDGDIARLLRNGKDDMRASQTLRSGLYLLRNKTCDVVYVIFWPQDTTWDDHAISPVVRNRVTFMRYLSKIADQIVALISDEHARELVWTGEESLDATPNTDNDIDVDTDDEDDRLFTFEVTKTREEEENVTASPGFEIPNVDFGHHIVPEDTLIDPALLLPRLIAGETSVGLLTTAYEKVRQLKKTKTEDFYNQRLLEFVKKGSFRIEESLSEEAFGILIEHGLGAFAQDEYTNFQQQRKATKDKLEKEEKESSSKFSEESRDQNAMIVDALRTELADYVSHTVSIFAVEDLRPQAPPEGEKDLDHMRATELLQNLSVLYPELRTICRDLCSDSKLKTVPGKEFQTFKKKLVKQQDLQDGSSSDRTEGGDGEKSRSWASVAASGVATLVSGITHTLAPPPMFDTGTHTSSPYSRMSSDADFLSTLRALAESDPSLTMEAQEAIAAARQHFEGHITTLAHKGARKIEEHRREECRRQAQAKCKHTWTAVLDSSRRTFLLATQTNFIRYPERVFTIHDIQKQWGSFRMSGIAESKTEASLSHAIRLLALPEVDKQGMQLDAMYIPKPRFSGSSFTFSLALRCRIIHLQLVDDSRCLLITRDETHGDVLIYLERLIELDNAVKKSLPRKTLRSDKLSGKLLFSYDESKRLLAVCTIKKFQIHVFVFDESYKTLTGLGSAIDLVAWYGSQTIITHMAFRGGAQEELLIIDGGSRARVLSLTTQQFRPASLQLPHSPQVVQSSADGSCFLSIDVHPGGTAIHAYHWTSFGSSQGIFIELHDGALDSLAITSFASRTRCHVVLLDLPSHCIRSAALHITHKSTEFTFRADERNSRRRVGERITIHNSIMDCHRDVWVRFPVVPAVRRQTFKSSYREPQSLSFISHLPSGLFSRYFADLIDIFERTTHKPVDNELSTIEISGQPYSSFVAEDQGISRLRAGEWLVELLCLIPIHVAVARDNRFVPLKDGVWSLHFERALLGATVEQVVDQLSFGWYESIFQSYMASKPVRVVSSMGEQSVGKSFALNHLVDTSFAGSAMRTTEGVWMSVTPTDDCLIVALDFEGVHSIERSAQEDSLLVLFNTAISNLVLFRNNFALSRDIAGLFQSFQSSATFLDPAKNPSLFKSELVIIIKDVVPSDMKEITKEFSLKFQQIVAAEQEANFISRLHGGKLAIIPWPVIESSDFYTSFTTVKKRLNRRPISHHRAGVFLHTVKTLMAKLKTNDWGSLDQNLANHRALQLQRILPIALRHGASEIEPDIEPLKDIDNGTSLNLPQSLTLTFYLPENQDTHDDADAGDPCLKRLQGTWDRVHNRQDMVDQEWVDGLDAYLEHCARARIDDVRVWLETNTTRFSSDTATFQALRRDFEACAVALRTGVQLCKLQCADCQLHCLKPRHHRGSHDCDTNHKCARTCSFLEDHGDDVESCGLPAGHSGGHICDISAHLCGQPCHLIGKAGCLERCSKVAKHPDGEHACPASAHECGLPCGLRNIRLSDGSLYNCDETCHISIEQEHDTHICKQQSCPVYCQLCRRLCSEPEHLHGLDRNAVHLCGQEHACVALCQSDGICRIETAPQSVEATFTGRHDTFQYTKYSQESKRLQCVIPIPATALRHDGPHCHSLDPQAAFHYCETRCQNCGYFCQLPRGHTQQEHETSHGSMSKTKWSVEDDSVVEVNGRKFGSNDDGAPLLCSMVCQQMGRHVHVDFCRTSAGQACTGTGIQHIRARMLPEPTKAKDFISHELYWRRTGFKDPYSHDDRDMFAKCDAMCTGREHQADANGPAQPSYCTQPIFHAPLNPAQTLPGGVGFISGDGHHFSCRNPALLQQAFHVIFVIDRSGSMSGTDRRPLNDTPVSARIAAQHNNRTGAVYSSLYGFWSTRHAVANGTANRRDAYSIILFDSNQIPVVANDFSSSPDQLLNSVLAYRAGGGTNYNVALQGALSVMEQNWSTERAPVIIFLSDGECSVDDSAVRNLCRRAVALGRALSFHAVAFGPYNDVLRRMADVASDVQRTAPADPMHPAIPSSYVEALDSVRLAETFLGIANSLTKPRGALMHG